MAQSNTLHDGDHVSWTTPDGRATGEILRRATCRLYIRDYEIKASPTSPTFVVRDQNGKLVGHKASVLRRLNN